MGADGAMSMNGTGTSVAARLRAGSATRVRRDGTIVGLTAALSLLLCAGSAAAQDDEGVWIEVAPCLDLESSIERYECYEARVEAALAEREDAGSRARADAPTEPRRPARTAAAPAASAAPADTPRDAAASERDSDRTSSAAADAARADTADDSDEITSTVASVRERLPNEHIITLDNGQVWHQIEPKRYFIRPGDEVRVYSSRFFGDSHYRLTVERRKGFIRVERVR